MKRGRLGVSRSFKVVTAGVIAGIFFLGTPPAHAIFGIRAARTAIAARKAKQTLAKDPNAAATERAHESLARLEQGAEETRAV